MIYLVNYFYYSAILSFLLPLFAFKKRFKKHNFIGDVLLFSFWGVFGNLLIISYSYLYGNGHPAGHVFNLIQMLITLKILNSLGLIKRMYGFLIVFSILLFVFESLILNYLHTTNEGFHLFSLAVIIAITFKGLKNQSEQNEIQNKFTYSFCITFFIYSVSSIILAIYEKDLRTSSLIAAFIVILINNLLTIFQNLGITYSLWKLKEA
jgi:hypothetical protein